MDDSLPPELPTITVSDSADDHHGSSRASRAAEKRKTIHTNVNVVESATRFWLSAQVMVACIMLILLALAIQDGRESITYFPATMNSTCVDATYDVRQSIQDSLVIVIDDAINATNTQYRRSVSIARGVISRSMNMTVDIFLLLLKQINPVIYCSIEGGLQIAGPMRSALRNLQVPDVSCNIPIGKSVVNNATSTRDIDPCQMAVDELNGLLSDVGDIVASWPRIPSSLTDSFEQTLSLVGFTQILADLSRFDAPDTILTYNTTEEVAKAMANTNAFDDIAITCTNVSVQFESATKRTADVMYYIEIAIWVSIGVLLVGIFIIAIIRQFPTLCVEWMTSKLDYYTQAWHKRLDDMEKSEVRTWKLYTLWTLQYINFTKALLTTAYGLIGIILIYNLTAITDAAQQPVEVWVTESLGPGFEKIQNTMQDGVNDVINDIEAQLNEIVLANIKNTLIPINSTLNNILTKKADALSELNQAIQTIRSVPVTGDFIADGVSCMVPLQALSIVDTAINIMVGLLQDIMNLEVQLPYFSFPAISAMAARTTHVAISHTVSTIQAELKHYQIIFIVLSTAFGILVLQALFFVALRRAAIKFKKFRRQRRIVNVN